MSAISKLGLTKKLSLSFGLQLVFIAGIGVVGFLALGQVTTNYRHIVEVNFPKEKLLAEFRMAQKDIVVAIRTSGGADGDETILDEQAKAIQDADAHFEKAATQFDALPSTETEKSQWGEAKEAWKPLVDLAQKIVTLSRSKKPEDLQLRNTLAKKEFDARRKAIRTPIEALRDFQVSDSDTWSKSADKTSENAKWTLVISGLLGLILGLCGASYLTLHIRNLLTRITHQLSAGADEVGSAAKQISASSEELSSSVTQQAAALQETSAAIEEISSMISKTAENATSSRQLSETSYETVQEGQKLVERMVGAIQEIDGSNAKINAEIEHSNREIQEIVKVIAEIGAKTQVIRPSSCRSMPRLRRRAPASMAKASRSSPRKSAISPR
jgi:methyl-accepting chemotaxis protein